MTQLVVGSIPTAGAIRLISRGYRAVHFLYVQDFFVHRVHCVYIFGTATISIASTPSI